MEKDRKRALRRMRSRNKWHRRIKDVYSCHWLLKSYGYYDSLDHYTSWKDTLDAKWSKIYKTMANTCNCWLCKHERYKRSHFLRETKRIIKEDLYD